MSDFNINEDAQSGGECSGSQSSNGASQPIESAFPDEDEETITMQDIIDRENKLEEEASAVLGNSDEKNCTYPKGYINRQALYSCATCSDGSDEQAAICLACSLECHDNHEVYELYTKRNYRCDCGNSKFGPDFECKLMEKQQAKLPLNDNNKYNHNFSGRYCLCDKRFPPDESDNSPESNDEMWQCIVCEDWYHTKHLGAKELPTRFDELICGQCVEKLDFVHYYKVLDKSASTKKTEATPNSSTNDNDDPETTGEAATCSSTKEDQPTTGHDAGTSSSTQVETVKVETANNICESDTNDSQAENKDPVPKAALSGTQDKSDCILESLKKELGAKDSQQSSSSTSANQRGPLFWDSCEWRSTLCRCQNCIDMYKAKGCEFLIDDKDTIQYYEAQGKALAKNNPSPLEKGMSALNRMNRAAVVTALHGYNELRADLSNYLRKFADTKKVVREEDIHEFFHQLKSKKKPRLEHE